MECILGDAVCHLHHFLSSTETSGIRKEPLFKDRCLDHVDYDHYTGDLRQITD